MFSEADFFAITEREAFCIFWQANVVAKDEKRVRAELGVGDVFSVFFEDVDVGCFCFCFEEGFEGGFVCGDSGVWFACEGFFEDCLPCFLVGSYVVELFPVYLQVDWRCWWSVEDCVEVDVFA